MEPYFKDAYIQEIVTDGFEDYTGYPDALSDSQDYADKVHKAVRRNLSLVSIICNIISFLIATALLVFIMISKNSAKSNYEKRKLHLYNYSIYFVSMFILMIICLSVVPFAASMQGYFDFILQALLLVQIFIYMSQWDEALYLYIKQKYIVMLQVVSVENRLTFTARAIALGKAIAKNCNDEQTATHFLKLMQTYCEDVYE